MTKPDPRRKKRTTKPYTTGFPCPTCKGVRLFVISMRRPVKGAIVRYRECAICGHRIKTVERAEFKTS